MIKKKKKKKDSSSGHLHILRTEFKMMSATKTTAFVVYNLLKEPNFCTLNSHKDAQWTFKIIFSSDFFCVCLETCIRTRCGCFFLRVCVSFWSWSRRHPVTARRCCVWRSRPDYQQSHQLFNEHRDLFLWKWVFPWKLWKPYPGLFKWGNMGKVSTTTWALFSQFKVRRGYFALQSHSSGKQYSGGGVVWGRGDRK